MPLMMQHLCSLSACLRAPLLFEAVIVQTVFFTAAYTTTNTFDLRELNSLKVLSNMRLVIVLCRNIQS
jgi:hypothetical protein